MVEFVGQEKDERGLGIDWLTTSSAALAAVTSAVLLSTFGAVGTIAGAALGSVAATVGTALYARGLAKSKETVAKAQRVTLGKVGIAQAEVRRASRQSGDESVVEAHLEVADERLAEARAELDEAASEATSDTLRQRLGRLPWKRISVMAAGTFIVVMLAITAFELLTGESLSSRTRGGSGNEGTTIGGVTNGGQPKPDPGKDGQPTEQPSETTSPSAEPTPTLTNPATTPTESSSVSVEPSPSETVPIPTDLATTSTPSVSGSP